LWQLDARQKYALVVDTSRSTLYVYENVKGEPRYVADYYITIGKLGTEKLRRAINAHRSACICYRKLA